MKSTIPSPSPVHDDSKPYLCECNDCITRGFQAGTQYWKSTKYTYAEEVVSEHSTNSTASNLPGPGRTLDKYLGKLGRKFHTFAGEIAHDLGFGPNATTIRVESRTVKFNAQSNHYKREKDWKSIVKDCRKMLKYIERCASSSVYLCDEYSLTSVPSAHIQKLRNIKQCAACSI